MFSYIKSKLLLILSVVTLCVAVWGFVASYGYVKVQKELSSLQTQYKSLELQFKELSESKEQLRKSYEIDNSIVSKNTEELKESSKETSKAVDNIIVYTNKCKPVKEKVDKSETDYPDINAPLDPEFIRLSESGIRR